MTKKIYLLTVLILSFTASAFAETDSELLKRVDDKLMPQSYEANRKLINIEPNGKRKEFTIYTAKKGKDKMVILFLAPASEKGRSTLRLGDNMWLYIPNVGRPIRTTSLQSLTGGVFNNADIMQVDYNAEYNVEHLERSNNGYLFTLKAKTKSVAYDKLKMWASKNEIVTKIECYSASGMLIKTLDFKKIKDFGNGIKRPSVIETYSPLYKGYLSLMIYTTAKAREFRDEVFTMSYMSKLDSLRK